MMPFKMRRISLSCKQKRETRYLLIKSNHLDHQEDNHLTATKLKQQISLIEVKLDKHHN